MVCRSLLVFGLCAACVTPPHLPEAQEPYGLAETQSRVSAGAMLPIDSFSAVAARVRGTYPGPHPEQALELEEAASVEPLSLPVAALALPPSFVALTLRNVNNDERIELAIDRDGNVAAELLPALTQFFACRRTGRERTIEPGVLRVLGALAEEFPGHTIDIVSGYRAAPYGVRESKHFEGRAIDLRVRGVKLSRVRDYVWRHFADVGVGYYGHQNFIHIDHRPEEKDTAWTSAHENARYEYNPRWAMRIRPPWREPALLVEDEEHPASFSSHGADPAASEELASVLPGAEKPRI